MSIVAFDGSSRIRDRWASEAIPVNLVFTNSPGSMEQGWLYVGMGCRMVSMIFLCTIPHEVDKVVQAVDLGMNQNADEWRDSRGEPLFSLVDRHARRQIWASCCIADKLSSIWLGELNSTSDSSA